VIFFVGIVTVTMNILHCRAGLVARLWAVCVGRHLVGTATAVQCGTGWLAAGCA
jgi:hypothetical protein